MMTDNNWSLYFKKNPFLMARLTTIKKVGKK